MRSPLLLVALLALVAPALAQDFSKVPVQVHHLRGPVHDVRAAGGNMLAVAGPDGLLLVDSDYAEMAARVDSTLSAMDAGPVRLIVNTHWHFDHVGGNEFLSRDGAVVVAQARTREYMSAPQSLAVIDTEVPASPPAAWPDICVHDQLTLHWGDEVVALYHVAGHTDTDLLVHLPVANVLHMGDMLFHGGYPYMDTEHGGSIDGLIAGVTRALGLCDDETLVVPGHGPLAGRDDLQTYLAVITEYRGLVAAAKGAGQTLEQVIEAQPAAHLDEQWGQRMFPPSAFMTFIYVSLP